MAARLLTAVTAIFGTFHCSSEPKHPAYHLKWDESSAPVSAADTAASVARASPDSPKVIPSAAPVASNALPPLNQPGYANLDPTDDFVEAPPDSIPDCEERLKTANVKFRMGTLPVFKKRGLTCGAPQVVQYLHGPTKIRVEPSPLVTCQLALAFVRLEEVANRTSREFLNTDVTTITQGGTYNCRSMARFKVISEHSYANAIDIYGFRLKDGRSIPVLRYFGDPKQPAVSAEGRFLRALANRLFDEKVCSVVVTRYYDELHRDHIHCDMAHYHVDGSR